MRSLSIQVQANRSPGIDIERLSSAFHHFALENAFVESHVFGSGDDDGLFYNFTFDTGQPHQLWIAIQKAFYANGEFDLHMRHASIAVCSCEASWESYEQLFHFDPAVKSEADTAL